MLSSSRLVIATRNPGKAAEIQDLLGNIELRLLSLNDFENVGLATETEDTYCGNAISKAQYYAAATGEWILADDSGLEVAALAGAPGVFSARYAGTNSSDEDRRVKLLQALAHVAPGDRTARFVCAVAFAKPNGKLIRVEEGVCEGSISREPHGISGFGYDPIFVPHGHHQTFGELPQFVKNNISHRAKAIAKMRAFLLAKNWSA